MKTLPPSAKEPTSEQKEYINAKLVSGDHFTHRQDPLHHWGELPDDSGKWVAVPVAKVTDTPDGTVEVNRLMIFPKKAN